MSEDKKYGGSASSTSRPGLSNPINKNWQKNIERMAKRRSTQSKISKASKTPRPAGLMGSADVMERRLKAASKGKSLTGKSQGVIRSNAVEEDPYAWLRDMMGGGGGGGGGEVASYSPEQIAAAQAAMNTNRARMEALYKRYAEDIASREADIEGLYTGSATNLGGIYDTSVANINKAYEAARAAQTQQLLNLGMTEQTPVQSFGNQTESTASLNNLRAAVLAQNEASRKAAITNQRLAAEGATRQGVGELTAYDRQAAQAIAEMQAARTSVGGGGGGGGGLSPYQYASLVLRQQENDMANQQAAAKMLMGGQGSAPVDVIGMYNDLVAQGTDPRVAQGLASSQARYMGSR
jgi:hypothetical protein